MNRKALLLSSISLLALISGIKTITFADVLTCDIKASCSAADMRMTYLSSTTNAHVEFAGGASNYPRSICCSSNGATVASTTLRIVETDRTGVTASSCAQIGGKVLFTFPGTHPSNTLYVTNFGSPITKINPLGVASILTTGAGGTAMTIDTAGNLYIANFSSNLVNKVTPSGVSSIFGTTGNGPLLITIGRDGNVYTSNAFSGDVTRITPAGASSTIAGFSGPQGITSDPNSNIYVVNSDLNEVIKITPSGATSTFATTEISPRGITIDSTGNIYTTNTNNSVTKITPTGVSSRLGTTDFNAYRLTNDSVGNIYTANQSSNNVTKITPGGASSTLATTGNTPEGITTDATGNVYTANKVSSNISKITPAGVSTIFATGLSDPRDLLITPTNGGHIGTSTAYQREACLVSTSTPWNITTAFQSGSCAGYGTTVLSMSQPGDNATVGASSTYNTKLCLTAWTDPTIGFDIDVTTRTFGNNFGTLTPNSTRWSNSGVGTATEPTGSVSSFWLDTNVSNVPGGFSIYMSGSNLTNTASSTVTIAPMLTPGTLTAGVEQFGMQARRDDAFSSIANTLDPNYGGSNYYYALSTSTLSLLNTSAGADGSLRLRVNLAANISPATRAGTYTGSITFVLVPNF